MNNIEIRQRVQHMARDPRCIPLYGTVININIKDKRAQVAWEANTVDDARKTWIKFESLKVIDDGWRDTPNMRSISAARTITLSDGTVYRQYRK